MVDSLRAAMASTFKELAVVLDGRICPLDSWFDGFWDFVVLNRGRLEPEQGWEMEGCAEFPWAIIFFQPELHAATPPSFEFHLFIENKDCRPGAKAPWPVATLSVEGDQDPGLGSPDLANRPHDPALAAELKSHGYQAHFGHWGLHVWRDFNAADQPALLARIRTLPDELPRLFRLAVRLCATSPRGG